MDEQKIETAWQTIRAQFETQRRALYDEIRNYPTPIAACDQQFNFLLEERGRIIQELRRLDETITASQAHLNALTSSEV